MMLQKRLLLLSSFLAELNKAFGKVRNRHKCDKQFVTETGKPSTETIKPR